MIWFSLGKWSNAAGRFLVAERLCLHGWKWTPLVRLRFRYLETLREGAEPRGETHGPRLLSCGCAEASVAFEGHCCKGDVE